MKHLFIVPGRPVPAVRMTQKSKFVDPAAQRYLDYKEVVGWVAKGRFKTPIEKNVVVIINFYYSKKGRAGDIDNLVKSILDGCNRIAWKDDQQVKELHAYMHGSNDQRTEVEIEEVGVC